jgi:outer membrane lipoprotein-sorting protein
MATEATVDKKQRKSGQMMIDNGKELFVVDLSNKKYFSQPHRPDRISKLFQRSIQNVIATGGVLKVSESLVENRPTYELTNSKPDTTVRILVDKATSNLKQVHMKRKDQISDLTLTKQRFNQPIPASVYAWTPPGDFQKVTVPSGQ